MFLRIETIAQTVLYATDAAFNVLKVHVLAKFATSQSTVQPISAAKAETIAVEDQGNNQKRPNPFTAPHTIVAVVVIAKGIAGGKIIFHTHCRSLLISFISHRRARFRL